MKKKKLYCCCSSSRPWCSLWKSKNDLLWQKIKEIFLILIINLWNKVRLPQKVRKCTVDKTTFFKPFITETRVLEFVIDNLFLVFIEKWNSEDFEIKRTTTKLYYSWPQLHSLLPCWLLSVDYKKTRIRKWLSLVYAHLHLLNLPTATTCFNLSRSSTLC